MSGQATTGREREALAGYRDAVDYFGRTGIRTHPRVALRNLAALLDRLGDSKLLPGLRRQLSRR